MRRETEIDRQLKIQTCGRDDYKADAYHHPYEPTPYCVLERLAESGFLAAKDVVIDYGCGKGRVDFYLSAKLGCRTMGIEYDERIFAGAVENRVNFIGRVKPEFFCVAAEQFVVEEGNCFYFFNPFTVEILRPVVGRILDSFYKNPRPMQLFFYFPDEEYVAYLMTRAELMFVEEIDCSDMFEGRNGRERILIFEVIG